MTKRNSNSCLHRYNSSHNTVWQIHFYLSYNISVLVTCMLDSTIHQKHFLINLCLLNYSHLDCFPQFQEVKAMDLQQVFLLETVSLHVSTTKSIMLLLPLKLLLDCPSAIPASCATTMLIISWRTPPTPYTNFWFVNRLLWNFFWSSFQSILSPVTSSFHHG